jgi:arylsulfatase A-like enzyme
VKHDGVELDGLDLKPLLDNPVGELDRDALFFHYPHYYPTTTPVSAIRAGSWKLLEYFEDDRAELYNLASDLGETTNLAEQYPERAEQLRERLHAWRGRVGAALPSANPDFRSKR